MTSFAVALEPVAAPRLACTALVVHLAVSASPWFAGVPGWLAAILAVCALAGLASSLAAVPGPHHRLAALRIDGADCRIRRRGSEHWQPATLGPGSRAFADLLYLDIRAGGGRLAWLLPRSAVPAGDFRRLKARVRLTC
ncbi:MAG TPA: hypothetical protein VFR77_02270 [Steroidobacteraceae bacterium]|nr:hypothetical protein [Steroidobacteraceae bacterium]